MQREQSCHLKCRIRGSKSKTTYFLTSSEMQWQGYQRKQNSLANEGTATTLRTNGRTANPAETRNSCTQKSWGAGFGNYLQINYPPPAPTDCSLLPGRPGEMPAGTGLSGGTQGSPAALPEDRLAGQPAGRYGTEQDGTGQDTPPGSTEHWCLHTQY